MSQSEDSKKKVDIRPLIEIAMRLRKDNVLRQILLVEPEEMDTEKFLAKVLTWLRLA